MKLKKLTEESCNKLLNDLLDDFNGKSKFYLNHDQDFIPLSNRLDFIESGSYEIDEKFGRINLKSDDTNGKYDFENAKIIFEALDGLTPLEANDKRLWVKLTHDNCHKYVVNRWMNGRTERKVTNIIERFFYKGSGQQSRIRNGVARLWWIAYLTVQSDEQNEDEKWKYTKLICESQDFITSILERTMGTYPNVRLGVLEYYFENSDVFENSKSRKIQQLLRDLNNYGGVTLLSLMTKTQVKEICSKLLPR